jgi:hypothetical protein
MLDTKYIDQNEFYLIKDQQHFCCGESQFVYVCKAHGEQMDCYFCGFDYDEPCQCLEGVFFTTPEAP